MLTVQHDSAELSFSHWRYCICTLTAQGRICIAANASCVITSLGGPWQRGREILVPREHWYPKRRGWLSSKLKVLSEPKHQESFSHLYLSSRLIWGFTGFSPFSWNEWFMAHFLTFDACLLVLLVNEQVARRVWEEGEGEKLNKDRDCIGCQENWPESLHSKNFSGTKAAGWEGLRNRVCCPCEQRQTRGHPPALSQQLPPRNLQRGVQRASPAARELGSAGSCCSLRGTAKPLCPAAAAQGSQGPTVPALEENLQGLIPLFLIRTGTHYHYYKTHELQDCYWLPQIATGHRHCRLCFNNGRIWVCFRLSYLRPRTNPINFPAAMEVEAVMAISPRRFRGAHSPAYMMWTFWAKPAVTKDSQGNANPPRSGVLEGTTMGIGSQIHFYLCWGCGCLTCSMCLMLWPCAFAKYFTK